MADESRLPPETINFDAGIKADSPGDSEDFADMVNLMPPPDGSAGVIPRLPLRRQSGALTMPEAAAGTGIVFYIVPTPKNEPMGGETNYHALIGVTDVGGAPIALFPHYDVVNALPEAWEDTTQEYTVIA